MFLKNLVQDPSISQTMATLAALAPSQDRLLECAHPCSCVRVFTHSNSRILNLQSCIYIYIARMHANLFGRIEYLIFLNLIGL